MERGLYLLYAGPEHREGVAPPHDSDPETGALEHADLRLERHVHVLFRPGVEKALGLATRVAAAQVREPCVTLGTRRGAIARRMAIDRHQHAAPAERRSDARIES